jgi:hypothetical protein
MGPLGPDQTNASEAQANTLVSAEVGKSTASIPVTYVSNSSGDSKGIGPARTILSTIKQVYHLHLVDRFLGLTQIKMNVFINIHRTWSRSREIFDNY